MKLTRIRIAGFKTFVEPTDIPIEPGLTGVVGPNGCGKSNLVEALRWAMGESSHKNMRAAGMDDVIFGGSATRPARNTAEVTLTIDNTDGAAPAAFKAGDALQVARRIERAHGSSYHVNGREVRARDVQLLFADAATGARSPALVRQGQIGELIAAKPQARRRILEDAAGIAGLHARRHEAELRLKHAEDNLVRVEDVVREIDAQVEGLRRQGRQAARYRGLSAEIRKLDAQLAAAAWRSAEAERMAAEEAERADVRHVAECTAAQGEAARAQAVAAHEIGPLREAEAASAAALQRLGHARAELDREERRGRERLAELERRVAELGRDAARQAQLGTDAADTIARLRSEHAALDASADEAARGLDRLRARGGETEARLGRAEAELAAVQAEVAELAARRDALAREDAAATGAADRNRRELERLKAERTALAATRTALPSTALRDALAGAAAAWREPEDSVPAARAATAGAREIDAAARAKAEAAERDAARLETEHRTLLKLFAAPAGRRFPTMLDAIRVAPGHEAAVAAALGDDLDASPDAASPLHWRDTGSGDDDPALPEGAVPLALSVTGPASLTRRLRQIGLVARSQGAAVAASLQPGQRLVSVEGDLWRWDGLTATADAPGAAARRLAERNRLAGLETSAAAARSEAERHRISAGEADAAVRAAAARESATLDAARAARRVLDAARDALARAERQESDGAARLAALDDAVSRVAEAEREARGRAAETRRLRSDLPDGAEGERRHAAARADAAEGRSHAAELRAALGLLSGEIESAARRRAALAADIGSWTERAGRAEGASAEIAERLRAAEAERAILLAAPDTFATRRRGLASATEEETRKRSAIADRLAVAETALAAADRAARATLDELAAARERRAASQATAEALGRRAAELARSIAEAFETDPAGLMTLAALPPGAGFDPAAAEQRLAGLKADRERLGGVNLRAEEELAEAEGKRDRLAGERDDLTEAIRRLRQAVSNLNREGRERLNAAFGTVAGHFRRLFATLFGGGEAELTLVDSDDPLEAGLEITAKPPGKRPQSLSLLSGGEQALTAIALIFAVFLTNPSPICVLDEVDAPLDDANVERYCDLLRAMAADTDTRFVVITHNPITMARMDRLFGVTMAERGISQLVSVDLEAAERLREAG